MHQLIIKQCGQRIHLVSCAAAGRSEEKTEGLVVGAMISLIHLRGSWFGLREIGKQTSAA